MENENKLNVVIIGIIFDPKTKKILIGRKEKDEYLENLSWHFPGGPLLPGEEVDDVLKRHIKEKTGLDIKNLGAIFSKTYPEKRDLLSVFFLTELFEGEEKVGGDLVELKWVSPKELREHFTTSFHKKLEEFLLDLV